MNNIETIARLPVIAGVEIIIDDAGRYSLNSLHRASGLGESKAPSKWLRSAVARDLVKEVEILTGQICLAITEGRYGGTFAHKLLMVSYTGWLSTKFQVQVNQAFLDNKESQRAAIPETLSQALRLAADQAETIEELTPKAIALDRIAVTEPSFCLRDAAKTLQVKPKRLNAILANLDWIYRRENNKNWIGYQTKIDQGLLEHKVTVLEGRDGQEAHQVRVTPKGLTKLAVLLGDQV